ncbi:MAG: hypothetical protein FWG43_03215 [Clostridiales bacterium]|nr:hypothetical protein [Clostridiales bacterium]
MGKVFPIVHYYVNQKIYGQVPPLMALGGLFPDLASGTGMQRDEAHQMGEGFYHWCAANTPHMLPLALGIISHGTQPCGADYYADEYWPGCEKGWCFERGKPWMERITAVTHLPEHLAWWKSHNFVEMCYELLTIEQCPNIGNSILAALGNQDLLEKAATTLNRYTGKDIDKIIGIFRKTPQIFSLKEVSPQDLALRQKTAFALRHRVYDADVAGMAALLSEMAEALRPGYASYMAKMIRLVEEMLGQLTIING